MNRVLQQMLAAILITAVIVITIPGIGLTQVDGVRVRGTLIVKFADGVVPAYTSAKSGERTMGLPGLDPINAQYNLQSFRRLFPTIAEPSSPHKGSPLARYHILKFPPEADLDALAAQYLSNPNVEDVEFDYYALMQEVPNDPYYPSMWNLSQPSDHDVDADSAWSITRGSPEIVLGVTDTGVLYDHEDLQDNIWVNPGEDLDHDGEVYDADDMNGIDDDGNGYVDDLIGWDFVVDGYEEDDFPVIAGEDAEIPDNDPRDFEGHGTHTSGTIAAATNNGAGVSGLAGGFGAGAPGCKIMCLRMGWAINFLGIETGVTKMSYVSEAFVYAAVMGARAINYSFGSSQRGGIEAATDYAVAHGVAICAAAGNSNSSVLFGYLQRRPDVITVAATNEYDERSSFSNFGPLVDISAPGSNIWSTVSNHYVPDYDSKSGTSMAAPHVVGLIGLLLSANPLLSREELLATMSRTADPTTDYVGDMGGGRINAYQAVLDATSLHIFHTPRQNTSDTTNPYTITARITSDAGLVQDSLSLFYRLSGSSGFVRVPMTPTGQTDEFSASIPAQSAQTMIEYGISAEDGSGEHVTSPIDFPAITHSFEVVGFPLLVYFPGSFNVELESGHQSTEPFFIRNDGNDDLVFALSTDSSVHLYVDPDFGSIPPGDSAVIEVLFDAVPVHQDTTFAYALNLSAQDSIGSDVDIPVTMHVQAPDFYVGVDPTFGAQLHAAGDTVVYAVTLTNFGFFSDRYDLNLSGTNWPTEVWDSGMTAPIAQTPTLSPNDQYTIYPRVVIPPGTPFEESDTLELIVQSYGDIDISGSYSAITRSAGDPDSIPWEDQFLTTTLDTSRWDQNVNVTVSELGLNEPSPPYSLNLNADPNADDQITTGSFDLSRQIQVIFSYWYQRTGGGEFVDSGDDLIFEFKNDQGEWTELSRQPGGGAAMTEFSHVEIYLPPSALHADFRLRIRSLGSIGPFDDWFVDDVQLYAPIPPSICYGPSSFAFNLTQVDSTQDTLLVCNQGPGELKFFLRHTVVDGSERLSNLLGPPPTHDESQNVADDQGQGMSIPQYPVSMLKQLSGATQIVAWIPYADITQEYANTLNALSLYYSDYTLSETSTLDPAGMEMALIGKDVLLIPEQETADDLFVLGGSMAGVLQSFLAGGGGIVACDGAGGSVSNFLRGAGVLDATAGEYVNPFNIETVGSHPVTAGFEGVHAAQNGTREIGHTDGQTVMVTEGTDHAVAIVKDNGGGRVVLFGWDYYAYADFMAQAIANAVQWSSALVWMSFDPPADTLAAGETTFVALNINTRTLGSGDYHSVFGIHSNDPYDPLVEIPVDLHVSGPEIDVHPLAVVDTVVEGIDTIVSLWVANLGEESLRIDSVISTEIWLTPDLSQTTVPNHDSVEIEITIGDASLLPGDHNGAVHIYSDDFDEADVAVRFLIHVGPDPDIWVTPESLYVVMNPNDSSHQTLMIGNRGEGTLSYTASTGPGFSGATVYANGQIGSLIEYEVLAGDGDYRLPHPGTIDEDTMPIASAISAPSPVSGIAFGPDGKLYAAAPESGIIYQMDSHGTWIEYATGSSNPDGIAFDVDGNLAVAEQSPNRIRFVHPDGSIDILTDLALEPLGLAYAESGTLYVTTENASILRVSPGGGVEVVSAGAPLTTHSAAFGPDGRLFVSTWEDGTILAIEPDGTVSVYANLGRYPEGLCFDVVGNLYVGNGYTGTISRINTDQSVDVIGSGYTGPLHLALDEHGLLYIGSSVASQIDTLRVGIPGIRLPYGAHWMWLTSENGDVAGSFYTDSIFAQHATVMQAGFSSYLLSGSDYYANILFASNDPDDDSLIVPVHLHVRSPEAIVRPDTLRMEVDEGQSSDSTLWIINAGDWLLDASLSSGATWLALPPNPSAIAPGDSVGVVISADASALIPGRYAAEILLSTSDPNRPQIAVPVHLDVGPDPEIAILPDSIVVALMAGDSTDTSMTILNVGLGTLAFQIRTEYNPSPEAIAEAESYPMWYYDPIPKGADDPRVGQPVAQSAGGPDSAGYRWKDSDEPHGPVFDWTDISGTGFQVLGLTDDNFIGPIPIGFAFPYYDSVYTEFYLCSNGYLGVGPTAGYSNLSAAPLPSTSDPDNIIAWFWSDLFNYGGANPTRVWMQGNSDRLVLQFDRVRRCCGNTPSISAQVLLDSDGTITFQYGKVESGFQPEYGSVGIENLGGTDGLGVAFNTSYVRDSLAVRFTHGVKWLSFSATSGTIPANDESAIALTIRTDDLDAAEHVAHIVVDSNDPDATSVAIPVVLTVVSPAPPCVSPHQGDMNGDSQIDAVDLNILITALFLGGPDPQDEGCPMSRGDFNASGYLDAVDLNALIVFTFFTGPGPCDPCNPTSPSCTR